MSQIVNVKVPQSDTTAFKAICDAKQVPYSQVFKDFLIRIVKNPFELGQIVVQRIIDNREADTDSGKITIYLGREMHKKFIEISDATLISRSSLATLIIQTIIANNKDLLPEA